jgi:hypothetical protein
MHIRWGRIGSALGIAVLGPPSLVGTALWATAPEPPPMERMFPGPLDCVTSEVLLGALPQHPDHGQEPTRDLRDEGAARALIAASRCRELGSIGSQDTYAVFLLVKHGLAWMDSHEEPALAYEHAVAVWELARDQQQAGSYLEVAVWQGLAGMVEENLEPAALTPHAASGLRARLERLAEAELDWDAIRAKEEHELWAFLVPALSAPQNVLWVGRSLLEVRLGTSEFLADRRDDEQKERARALFIATDL